MTELQPPIRISNSEIQTFKDCRRRWWFSYYRRLKPKQQEFTGALALGSRIHEAMDRYYSSDMELDLLEIHSELVATDRKILMDAYRDTSDLESEAELGHIMLAGYLEWVEDEGIDVELERISNEEVGFDCTLCNKNLYKVRLWIGTGGKCSVKAHRLIW